MEKIKSSLVDPILKSFLPLFVGGSYHLCKRISASFSLTAPNLGLDEIKGKFEGGDRVQDSHQISLESMPSDFLSVLNKFSFGIYNDFFAFLLVMLLIDILVRIILLGVKGFKKEAKSSGISLEYDCSRYSSSFQKGEAIFFMSKKQIRRILSYALIFISLQIAGLCFMSFSRNQTSNIPNHFSLAVENPQGLEKLSPRMKTNDDQENDFGGLRILEQEDEGASDHELVSPPSSPPLTSDKISLSMGSVLSSLNLNVNSMVLSKDRKIAYVTLDYYGTLKVIDISDLQSPFVRGSLSLQTSTYNYRIKNLLLSSDEKTLYASNSRDIEIIDITDRDCPKLLSFTKSEIFTDGRMNEYFGYFKTSLAVQENTKTLYIGGLGLQVYDISDPRKPLLLKAFKNDLIAVWSLSRNEICLSRDGEILFIANGTLDVYNISNPRDMKLLYSLKSESYPRSILLSEDEKTAFLLGTPRNYEVIFEEVDISDYAYPSVRNTVKLEQKSINSPSFLAVSPNKSKLFILAYPDYSNVNLLVFDRVTQTTIKNGKTLIEDTFALDFSPDSRTLVTASNGQFMTIELLLNYPNSQIFSESLDNLRSQFSLGTTCAGMQLSNDGKYLFVLRLGVSYVSIFEVWEVTNTSEPILLSSFNWGLSIKQMHLTKNQETAYLVGERSLLALDITNRSSLDVKKVYSTQGQEKQFWHFATSPDEKTGFLITQMGGFGNVTAFDLSESSPFIIEGSAMLDRQFKLYNSKLIVKDEKTLLICLQEALLIYNISNLDAPVQIASLTFSLNEPEPETSLAVLSPDKKTLYIETSDKSGFHKLRVYSLLIPASPQLLSEKYFSKLEHLNRKPGFSLSLDLKSGFIFEEDSLLKLDVANPREMKISGIIPFGNKGSDVANYLVSPDGQTIYASIGDRIRILNMNIKYSLFLKQEKFLLGEKYSGDVAILNLTGASTYNVLDSEAYKITKLSLLDIRVAPNKALPEVRKELLPSWILFDSEGDVLTVDAKKQREIGIYTLHSAFSLKIPKDIFKDLPVSSRDLWAWLISLNYVDNELFLTASFGPEETFFLPDQFEDSRVKIYSILKKYSVETSTRFEIVSSLKVEVEAEQKNNAIQISTLSLESIKVEVQLDPKDGSEVKFVSCPYGSIVPVVKNINKTKISLEGSMREINTAMNSIVVNFENGRSCDASIMINDGSNPRVLVGLTNISRYFKANAPPKLNQNADKTVQEQLDSADIQTGKYFTFTLAGDIFEVENAESLRYELVMANNGTAFPTWLSFGGLTLKGTPPQEVLGRDIDLVLIAQNEFKQVGVPLTLHVKISLALYLQLVLKYIPYVLTVVGLLVSANKIWNIFGTKHYKHFKEFYLDVGQEVSPALIEPISFIKEELEQSRLILKYLGKMEKDKRNLLLPSLIDPITQVLDKEKVTEKIQEAVNQMSPKDRQTLKRYPSPIIDKIIVNKFVLMQLELGGEARTKSLFEELEPFCMEVVERNGSAVLPSSSSLELSINQNKLDNLIKRIRPDSLEANENLEESLIGSGDSSVLPGVNISLLQDAILALAFENHTLDILPINLDIGVKQRIPANFLWRFLKLDLRDIYLNEKTKINYGINYQIIDDKLCFYGVTQNYFKDKTIIVQVKNLHQRIMKEIWIHGVSSDFQRDVQGYEIY